MKMLSLKHSIIVLFLSILINFQIANAANFNDDLREIRAEINRDNLQDAIKKIKKIKISNENEQEKTDLLFGDIYLKINQIDKAEEFYQKTFFTSNEEIEAKTFIGLAEVRLAQGKLSDAIKYAEQSIQINPNKIRPKIILAIAKTRIGEGEESIKILNELYENRKDAEVALAISDYYSSFDDSAQAINILEEFIKRDPNNIKVLDQLASLHLFDGNKEKAIKYKLIVYKYYEFNRNRNKQKQAKAWILSVDPKYFDKPVKVKKEDKKEQEEYQEDEISNYDDNKVTPNYEEFAFAPSGHGSGFVVGDGKYVITNHHVIDGAKKVAVRNGLGKVTEATVAAISKDYDLAILELSNPYPKSYSIDAKDFVIPKAGDDVISIGYPGIGITYEQPTITQGIISKVFDDEMGIFLTTAAINSGNSGGPLFNLNGKLVGVSFAALDKKKWLDEMGQIPTDMGYAIKSNMIKEVFKHDKSVPVKSAKYDKATIYEKMLPSIALVVVLLDD
ncbi:trypsin-like peptidase domain-containing protein [Candidatus Pelagibacter ubique]|nr:trypsin-like peptidase domain-containing protein [Candidatus Pelagibacter ubique]